MTTDTPLDDYVPVLCPSCTTRRTLERDLAECRAALRELVECKDLIDRINKDREACYQFGTAPSLRLFDEISDYERRKPLAWSTARALATKEPQS